MSTDTAINLATRPRPRPRPSSHKAVPASELLARAAHPQAQLPDHPPAAPVAAAALISRASAALPGSSSGGGRHSHARRQPQEARSAGFQLNRFPTITLSEPARSVLIWVVAFLVLFYALYRINGAING